MLKYNIIKTYHINCVAVNITFVPVLQQNNRYYTPYNVHHECFKCRMLCYENSFVKVGDYPTSIIFVHIRISLRHNEPSHDFLHFHGAVNVGLCVLQ
jgi:hypothetical protein